MRKLDRVLLVAGDHDPPQGSLATAVALARLGRGSITVADVQPDGASVTEIFRADRRQRLASLLGDQAKGLRVTALLLDGEVGDAVGSLDPGVFDVVVVAGGNDRLASDVLRFSPVPVWLPGEASERPRRVLAAVDVAEEAEHGLGDEVLDTALWISRRLGAELEVSSVWTPPGVAGRLAGRLAGRDPLGDAAARSRERLAAVVDRALERAPAGTRRPAVHLAGGNPTELLAEVAAARDVDLIVAGHAGRSGPPAWLEGNTAERLERRVGCALLAVKRADRGRATRAA